MIMLVATTVLWWVFVSVSASVSLTMVGPFNTKADCEYVQRQVVKELQPRRAVCVETPTARITND